MTYRQKVMLNACSFSRFQPKVYVMQVVIIINNNNIIQYNTYLLNPWNRVLLEKLTGSQLVKKFPVFYGTEGS